MNGNNQNVANLLYGIADLLELKGVPYKPGVYRRAAQNIEKLTEDIRDISIKNQLDDIPGVGKSLSSKIQEFLESGSLKYLNTLKDEIPKGLVELLNIEGLGPKSAFRLYNELKISSIDDLEKAAKEGKIRHLEGFGSKSEANILRSIDIYKGAKVQFLLGEILPLAEDLKLKLSNLPEIRKISLAGSVRRMKETVGDLDILIATRKPETTMKSFISLPEVKTIIEQGTTKCSVVLNNNFQVDLRVIDESSFGSALQYFTGSKDHNIKLRKLAIEKKWKLSEYGLFDRSSNNKLVGEDEADIYRKLGLSFIEPELRENLGEIEAAIDKTLPKLVNYDSIKGDLHVHTKWSDGSSTIEEMAKYAQSMNLEYIAICDHSGTLKIAHGLDEKRLLKQMKEIEKINVRYNEITVLSGIEANINGEGNLDVSNKILKDLDVVTASIHSGFKQSKEKMTLRIMNAMSNDYVKIIGHPTGRILNKRDPYQLDLKTIFEEAAKKKIHLEINSFPDRLDLSDKNCFQARKYNIKFSIGSDAHHSDQIAYLRFGMAVARRGWLSNDAILNTLPLKNLKKLLNR